MKIFSPDSKVMIAMGKLGDLILLNFFFLLTCVPIFTIGAALTALYTVAFRMADERDNGVVMAYFRAFRENFRQGTVLWLIIAFVGICTGFDIMLFSQLEGPARMLYLPAVILMILLVLVAAYTFPLLSQFGNSNRQTLKNALFLSMGYLPRSTVIAILNIFPFAVLYFNLALFLETAFLWVFLYFAAIAYLNALLLKKVFAPYLEEERL